MSRPSQYASVQKLPTLVGVPYLSCVGQTRTASRQLPASSPSHAERTLSPRSPSGWNRRHPSIASSPTLPSVTTATNWKLTPHSIRSASSPELAVNVVSFAPQASDVAPDAAHCKKQPSPRPVRQSSYDRPWRKSKADCDAERLEAQRLLSGSEATDDTAALVGIDAGALMLCLTAQELLVSSAARGVAKVSAEQPSVTVGDASTAAAWAAIDHLRQIATNAAAVEEVDGARELLLESMRAAGFDEALQIQLSLQRSCGKKAIQQVMPGLWLGGWAALDKEGEELQRRGITHVVSVLSTELPPQRQMPKFVQQHLHVRSDDREGAAQTLGERFVEICIFVENARAQPEGCVFVHCGAGISRAPTVVAAYMMWKTGLTAFESLQLIERVRPIVRPNLGFIRELRHWEQRLRLLLPPGVASVWTPPAFVADVPDSSQRNQRRSACPTLPRTSQKGNMRSRAT